MSVEAVGNRADLPRDGRPGPSSSGPTERRRTEFVYRTWTSNNCTAMWPLQASIIPSSSVRLVRARGPLADCQRATTDKRAFPTSRDIMSELWKARAAAGRALEITPTRALRASQLCGHFAARQPHHARPGLNGSLLGYPRPRCNRAGSLWRVCAALRGRKAKISRQDATGFGVRAYSVGEG